MSALTDKKKILVVEDEIELLTILQIRLSKNNYEVFTASNGNSGYEIADSIVPDIILLDIMMPGKDGFTLLRELKGNEKTCNIPVIMVTARDRLETSCAIEGADGFIVKPFDYKELETKINRLINI